MNESIAKWEEFFKETDEILLCQSLSGEDLRDAFYRDLAFGTGGLRGILGLGSNRMSVSNRCLTPWRKYELPVETGILCLIG